MYDDSLIELRKANISRQLEWDTGSEKVSVLFRAVELAGEVGELLNAIKKIERGNYNIKGASNDLENLKDEFGDVLICLDLLANSMNIDLKTAYIDKFNKTSTKHNFVTKINHDN